METSDTCKFLSSLKLPHINVEIYPPTLQSIVNAAQTTRESLPNPVDGTLMTVYEDVGSVALKSYSKSKSLSDFLKILSEESIKSVRSTPDKLPILKEADVVDSGGLGFSMMINSWFFSTISKTSNELQNNLNNAYSEMIAGLSDSVSKEFYDETEEIEWGNCTVFTVKGEDIDIDFQDDRRDMVYDYLREKYGNANVAKLGTISRYKAKSTITEVAKELNIPQWEVNDLKGAIIERSGGDARAAFCIMDTFNDLDIGREILKKYPQMRIASQMEFHARHNGVHAAGIIVTEEPVSHYCSVSAQTGAAQIDKKDAEDLNLLKIDALGLRTLSVIQDILDQVGRILLSMYPIYPV